MRSGRSTSPPTRNVLGKSLNMNGASYTIVGVMPRDFAFPQTFKADAWQPLRHFDPSMDRRQRYVQTLARLKPGVSMAEARAEMTRLADGLARAYPATNEGWSVGLAPLAEQLLGGYRAAFGALLGAVGVLLLMAWVNIASVFLARNTARRHELALRAALGAGRRRLAQQVLMESMLLALPGGGAGLLLARAGTRRCPPDAAVHAAHREVRVDLPVFCSPRWRPRCPACSPGCCHPCAARRRLPAMRCDRGPHLVGQRRHGLQTALVVTEVALSIVLLVGGGLMVRSFAALLQQDHGFQADTCSRCTSLCRSRVIGAGETRGQRFRTCSSSRPAAGGAGAGAVTGYPDSSLGFWACCGERDPLKPEAAVLGALRAGSAGYFRAMGIPVLAGRGFSERDGAGRARHGDHRDRRWRNDCSRMGTRWAVRWRCRNQARCPRGRVTVVGVVGDVRLGARPGRNVRAAHQSVAFWSESWCARARTRCTLRPPCARPCAGSTRRCSSSKCRPWITC